MENRRPTTNNTPRPLNRTNNFRKPGDRPSGARDFQPRDSQIHPRNDRFQSRDNRNQTSDNRNQSREERFQGRDNNQGRDDNRRGDARFLPRNDKFQPRGRFAPKGKSFKPREQEELIRIVSDMQVTDGKHRGKYLKSTTSAKVRPTARRIREVMFRILFRRVRAGRFLDLCAGSGTVGIEAISRGALLGTFVERSAQMCGYIKKNLEACGIKEGHGEIHEIEVVPFLKRMEKRRRYWDVVYFDPPYDSNYDEVLAYFGRGAALKPHGVLVIEHHAEMFFPETFGVMKRWRVVVQGDTALSFYERGQ
ncbi:MAG: 16S rRNA (guanine(966)-N(2))-methyltransferase RsmD [Acidobacteria bacterium]|jgi:16S rRNA (guanine(966)-N(2))-methyltransferase RsmD|nr:16S rRNA (guanine(966)-N(2))-methyltransferase RsmD [Acidobacteriota bacterium]